MAIGFGVIPMKAALGSLPPVAEDDLWAYEIKWDGYRTLAHIDAGHVRLQSSSGNEVTPKYPELAGIAGSVHAESAVLDGEVVALAENGHPDFGLLQRHAVQVVFYAFDVLAINGHDTTGLGYEQRRSLLESTVDAGPNWAVPAYRVGDGAALAELTDAQGLEGIMAKRLGSVYVPGKRTQNWRKIKHRRLTEVVIGGFSAGTGSRATTFGSLLVGVTEPDGRLRYAGGVGTGFDRDALATLFAELSARVTPDCPFDPAPPKDVLHDATWVIPTLRARIEIAEWTNVGVVRHASFIELA